MHPRVRPILSIQSYSREKNEDGEVWVEGALGLHMMEFMAFLGLGARNLLSMGFMGFVGAYHSLLHFLGMSLGLSGRYRGRGGKHTTSASIPFSYFKRV